MGTSVVFASSQKGLTCMLGTDAWLSASCDKHLLPALPEGDRAHEIGYHNDSWADVKHLQTNLPD
jgi:hypothetical protein